VVVGADVLALLYFADVVVMQGVTPVIGKAVVIVAVSSHGEGDPLGRVEDVFGLEVYIVAVVIAVSQIDAQDAASVFIGIVGLVFIFQELDAVVNVVPVGISHPIFFETSVLPFTATVEVESEFFFEIIVANRPDGTTEGKLDDVGIAAGTDQVVGIVFYLATIEGISVFGDDVDHA